MKKILTIPFLFFSCVLFSQETVSWSHDFQFPKSIVKNEGQFSNRFPNENIQYVHPGFSEQIFFCQGKVILNFTQVSPHIRTDQEIRERAERKKKDFSSNEEWEKFQKEGHKVDMKSDLLITEWVGADPNAAIVTEGEMNYTHGYLLDASNGGKSISGIHSYSKLTYKNIYPHIDIEYIVHENSGIKYSIILRPGADLSLVKLKYSKSSELQTDGSITTSTVFGDIIDHSPYTFYEGTREKINSSYELNGNEITFQLDAYDSDETVIIDPWTQSPTFVSNWDCVWECETDAAGNAYIIGGVDNMQLLKYNAAGALQWTYNTPYDTSSWLGTMVTDNAGNTFVTQGSVAAMIRVSTAGALAWSVGNGTGQLSAEYWNIALNCNQTKLVTAGTGGGIPPQPYIYDINPANGAVLSNIQVTQSSGLFSIEEVRSITATENEKYYWMTHDSIGYVSQVFNICPATSTPVKTANTYNLNYKCENFRYNNSGLEAIAYYGGYAYVNRGDRLDKRDFTTGAIIASAVIPGGVFSGSAVRNSGIAIDNCGNIFVGSANQVVKYNQALTNLASYAVAYNVYDVAIGTGGEVIACGSTGTSATASRTGTVTSIAGGACAPYAMVCCNTSVCNPGPLCLNDPPITLTPEVTGGTWSSTAPGFNASTGVFNPAVAGVGSYTFTYTLPCGSSSITVTVNGCVAMTACLEANGSLTVSGGSAPFNWTQPTHTVGCVSGTGAGCALFTKTGVVHAWTNFGTGTTVTPTVGADTITVTDGLGTTFTSYNISTLPACALPLSANLVLFEGERNPDENIQLHWITSSEVNNDYFTVRRSYDGIDWEYSGMENGSGTVNFTNEYKMENPNNDKPVIYFQLSQTDFHGENIPLSIIALNYSKGDGMISSIHPNPADHSVQFLYTGKDMEKPLRIHIINALGKEVKEFYFNELSNTAMIHLDLTDLASGMYQLITHQGSVSSYHKIIIQH